MDSKRIQLLVEKFIENSATPNEELELMDWYRSTSGQEIEWLSEHNNEEEMTRQSMLAEINGQINHTPTRRLNFRWIAAASVLLFFSIGAYLYLKPKPAQVIAQVQNELKPGTNGAVLTLANGLKVILGKTKVGTITNGVKKSNDSLIVYNNAQAIGYNTLETQKGHQYSVVLSDGSKVWLNAASSLKYPTRFTGRERVVELTGEAYFEVVHHAKIPFRVKTNKQVTEDIGTSFNINSYDDEPATTTTLVEGAVKVNEMLIRPGNAAISNSLTSTVVKKVNVDEVISWKNGAFSFNKTEIKPMMRQIARWYDVEVDYEGPVPTKTITGDVYRNVNASQALQILTYLNIHYRIEGKKIIITQ